MTHPTLIEALQRPACYPHAVDNVQLIETHISWVLLTGAYAYKIKKPVDLGFYDGSSLERRRHFCDEELRLNSRLAPDLYLGVVAITGSAEAPAVGGDGPAFEYAVKMRQFPPDTVLEQVLAASGLSPAHVDDMARMVAAFHAEAVRAADDDEAGTPQAVQRPVTENFAGIRPLVEDDPAAGELATAVEQWTTARFAALEPVFRARKDGGAIRECHGDLHLGNMVLLDDRVRAFDGIEFNAALRWIDVISEIAFVAMDLRARGRADYAYRFIDAYLSYTGDYDGLAVLDYYLVYRAMVRAKIHRIRSTQSDTGAERTRLVQRSTDYLELADRLSRPRQPFVAITHGPSGSGKTTVTQPLVEALGAVRVRSDVERKRLYGLSPEERSGSGVDEGIYTPEAHRRTHERLEALCRTIVGAGYPVLVDATFLDAARRHQFRTVADVLDVPFVIVSARATEAELRRRVAGRAQRRDDASEAGVAVLERQLQNQEPLTADEQAGTVTVDTEDAWEGADVARRVSRRVGASPA